MHLTADAGPHVYADLVRARRAQQRSSVLTFGCPQFTFSGDE